MQRSKESDDLGPEIVKENHYIRSPALDDLDGFIDDHQLNFDDMLEAKDLFPVLMDQHLEGEAGDSGLTAIYQFVQAPKTTEEFWELVRSRYQMPDSVGAEFTELVDELAGLGFSVAEEWQPLMVALDELVKEGTISLTGEALERYHAAEAAITSQQETADVVGDLTMAQAGLFALLGVGVTAALAGLKKAKKAKTKKVNDEHIGKVVAAVVEAQVSA